MSRSIRRALTAALPLSLISTITAFSPAIAATPVDIRMTVSPTTIIDSTGAKWSPVGHFVGGSISSVNNNKVTGTPDPQLFVQERYGMSSWSVPVRSACYDITLKAREKYFSKAGARVFSVKAEGKTIVSNLDIFATVGANRAVEATYRIPVTDGRLTLEFNAKVDNALISAARVREVGAAISCGGIAPSPTPAPVPTPAPPAASAGAGAAAVGTARYPVPAGAIFVSTSGTDAASGGENAPLRTVKAALTKTVSGGTIVLREGVYHESVLVPPGKAVTIQPYTGEKVWFDGSRLVSGFTRDGSAWSAPWTVKLDSSPTYTRGAADGTSPGWAFVSATHPMAAHPDQVWIDDVRQKQVGSRNAVAPGTFYVDHAAGRLVLGSDPTGHRVHSGVLPSAFSLRAPGTVLRGFGIRRFVPSVPDFGAVTSFFPGMTLEQMTVESSSTAGVGLYAADCTVRSTTIRDSGMIGLQGNEADRLTLDRILLSNNNIEHFNAAPVAGGMKFARSRGVTLRDSEVSGNEGIGVWFDESAYDVDILRNIVTDNTESGAMLELTSKSVVAGNTILRSGLDALAIRNTNDVKVWNNTLEGAHRAIEVSQDSRRPSNSPSQLDARFAPDAAMTFVIADIAMRNNVLVGGPKGLMTLGVEDFDASLDATAQRITADGNVYAPLSARAPVWLAAWSRSGTDPYVHTDLASFSRTNGQERTGVSRAGQQVIDGSGVLRSDVAALAETVAHPLPADVAEIVGRSAGTRALGAWR